jgi:hypothetical protein
MRPDGWPIWVSDVEPGSQHDLNVAREHALGALYAAAVGGRPTLADPGYEGAGYGVFTPVKHPPTDASSISTIPPTTCCCARCGVSGSAGSRC